MEPHLPIRGFDIDEFIDNPLNVVLTDGEGNYSLFEREEVRGLVTGHYFFVSRGGEALNLCKEMLSKIFTGPYGS
jgi:DNA/RNA-binding domain of Phe-tRNA-synthetase-like protein